MPANPPSKFEGEGPLPTLRRTSAHDPKRISVVRVVSVGQRAAKPCPIANRSKVS